MEDSSRPVFTIGVVADIIGVSVQTLRLWDQKGLIMPSRKGKDRYYSSDDLKRLKYIKYLLNEKKLNTNLKLPRKKPSRQIDLKANFSPI